MIETHLSLFDASVVGVMLLSSVFAFYRGFVREVLSLGAWIGAGIVTMYYFPAVAEAIKPHFKKDTAAAGIAALAVYTGALITFSIFNIMLLKFIKSGSDVGMLDNLLGLAFGALRGGVMISLAYFLYTIAFPNNQLPVTVTKSLTYPYVEKGAIMLASVAPEYLREISSLEKKGIQQMEPAAGHEPVRLQEQERYGEEENGYNSTSEKQMDQLLDKARKTP